MKKLFIIIFFIIFAAPIFQSCDITNSIDEEPETTEVFFTEKKKAVNTNGNGQEVIPDEEE